MKQCVAALNRPRTGPPRKRRQARVRLVLERLEDRLAPAAVSWTGNAGTLNWSDKDNWSNNAVPTSSDDVTISKSVSGTIIIGSGSYAVNSLNDTTAALSIAPGGTLSLSAVAATSTFAQAMTVQSGGTLTIGAGANVQIGSSLGVALTDDGTLTFASGDTVTLNLDLTGAPQIVVGTGGLMNASDTAFKAGTTLGGTQIVVNSGGHLTASGSTFTITQVDLKDGSVLNSGDLSNDAFNTTLYVPILDVPLLTNNQSFEDVDINAGDSLLNGQSVTLTLMGTTSTANLLYILTGNLTVNQGASLTVASGVHLQIGTGAFLSSAMLTDDGKLTFASGDTATFDSYSSVAMAQIVVGNGGVMSASDTLFNATNSQPTQIVVNSGGTLQVSDGSFALSSLSLNSGSTDTMQFAHFATVININSGASLNISSNDFSNVSSNGIVATGASTSTIDLTNNYWGTSVAADIADKVLDHHKDATRPTVLYQPFYTGKPVQTVAADVTTSYSSAAQNVTLSAAVTSPSGTVTEGTVTFTVTNGSTTIGTAQGTVSGGAASAGISLPGGQAVGSYTIAVGYSDSLGQFSDTGDTSGTLIVKPASVTTTAKTVTAAYSPNAQTVTLSAAVADPANSSDTVNEGTVTFTVKNGNTTIDTVQGTVSGGTAKAGITLAAGLAIGTSYSIDVVYADTAGNYLDNGDTNSALTVAAAKVSTTAGNVSVIYSLKAQTLSFNATVTDSSIPTDTVNEGTVTFTVKNGGTTIGTAQGTVSAGKVSATFALPAGQAAGSYTIAVSYSDSAGLFTDGGDTNAVLTIAPANVNTTATNASAVYSPNAQTVTLNATVANASAPTDSVNEGAVTFTVNNGNTIIGTAQGTVSGGKASASFSLPAGQAAGSYTIAVGYSDSAGNFADSGDTNATLSVAVAKVTTTAGNVSAVYSPNAQTLTLNAAVADASVPADTVGEGTVTFVVKNGSTTIGTVQGTVSSGKASASFTLPAGQAVGSYTITVGYSDSAGNFTDGGDTNASLSVTAANVSITASNVSTLYSPNAQSLTLNATVADASILSDTVNEGTVTFTVKNGNTTIGTAQGAVSSGKASGSFTLPAGQAAGDYTIVVSYTDSIGNFVDGGDTSATLAVQIAPVVTTNPSDQTITVGQSATFTAAANGNPTPTVQWQVSSDGGKSFTNISGATSPTLTLANVNTAMNGYEYQAVFTNSIGSITTSTATLTVQYAPAVTTNPTNQTVTAGDTATFTAAASGNPAPTVQWQVSSDGGKTFTNISGATSTTLTLTNVPFSLTGSDYQAVFTNGVGTATTTAANLTVQTAASITSGNSATFTVGQFGSFTVTATGSPTPSLTELGGPPSGVSFKLNGNGTATLAGTPAVGTQGTYSFTIDAYNGVGSDFTQHFTLTVNPVPAPPPPPSPLPSPPSSPPSPPQAPTLNVPPLLALLDSLLGASETVNADGTVTVTDSFLGFPLVAATFDGSGNFLSASLFGINVPISIWNL